MKYSKFFFALLSGLMVFMASDAVGQNLQLHYDFDRRSVTSTVEMFRADGSGSTFFFVDLDYSPKVTGAYWEIARELCFWKESKASWLSVHVEYNGGLNTQAGSFNNAFLGGLTYSGHSEDWSKTWSLSAMYKLIPGTVTAAGDKQDHNFQITGVWNLDFFDHWISFMVLPIIGARQEHGRAPNSYFLPSLSCGLISIRSEVGIRLISALVQRSSSLIISCARAFA